jgi:hypothetical protein
LNRQPAAPVAFDFFDPLPVQIEVFDAPLYGWAAGCIAGRV